MARRRERATVRIDPFDPSPEFLRGCFAEVFASLDERPRPLAVDVYVGSEGGLAASVDMADGNPVFMMEGLPPARADFRRRWLAEHPVPLAFRKRGATRLVMIPTSGNRVKVRLARRWPLAALFG